MDRVCVRVCVFGHVAQLAKLAATTEAVVAQWARRKHNA